MIPVVFASASPSNDNWPDLVGHHPNNANFPIDGLETIGGSFGFIKMADILHRETLAF